MLLFLLSCSEPDGEVLVSNGDSIIGFDQQFVLPDFPGGQIMSMAQIDNTIYFTDLASRSIHGVNLSYPDSVFTVGSSGRGPGEYEFPLHLKAVNEQHLAWSDISKSEINVISTDAEFVARYEHTYGGGRNFEITDEYMFITPSFSHLINIIPHNDRENAEQKFELSAKDRAFLQSVPGGGGVVFGGDVVALLPHLPELFIYDESRAENKSYSIIPDVFQEYHDNFMEYYEAVNRPSDISFQDLQPFLVINRVHKIQSEGEEYLVLEGSVDQTIRLFIFDTNYELVASFNTENSPLGVFETTLLGASAEEYNVRVKMLNLSEKLSL
ncbi:MAG: hypothetical protein LAT67_15105 [Balneolales bacterium]|nr:hypothetical protein [Balneolales bacterium]